jgi:hypothetical protein
MKRRNTGFLFVVTSASHFFYLPQVSTTTVEDKQCEWCFVIVTTLIFKPVHRFKVARGEILIL